MNFCPGSKNSIIESKVDGVKFPILLSGTNIVASSSA
jgi:hypothetical protein